MSKWPKPTESAPTTFGGLSRSSLMSLIKGKGSKTTEMKLSRLLQEARLKGWRRHLPLPGKPDFAWLQSKVAVFVDGCFWHGHDCGRNLTPKSNAERWREKILKNKKRDRKVVRELRNEGWSVIRIWECELAKNPDQCLRRIKRVLTLRCK